MRNKKKKLLNRVENQKRMKIDIRLQSNSPQQFSNLSRNLLIKKMEVRSQMIHQTILRMKEKKKKSSSLLKSLREIKINEMILQESQTWKREREQKWMKTALSSLHFERVQKVEVDWQNKGTSKHIESTELLSVDFTKMREKRWVKLWGS